MKESQNQKWPLYMGRRAFLTGAAGWGGALAISSLRAQTPAVRPPDRGAIFSSEALATVAAIAAQVIPRNQTPGADDAHVADYIERQVTDSPRLQKLFLTGLKDLDDASRKQWGRQFAKLTPARQRTLLQSIQKSEFFRTVRVLTIRGFYNSPIGFQSVGYPGPGQPMGHRDFAQAPGSMPLMVPTKN
jgi:gluconate 2-dehydrogenase subunit 3-like protein